MAVRAKTRKVVIIGAGHVGAHCASSLMNRHLVNEIVFLDMNQEAAHAQVLDLDDLAAGMGDSFDIRVGDYGDCEDAKFVVVTAGRSRRPGESRLDMLSGTKRVLDSILDPLKDSGFRNFLISVSNPSDVVTEYIYRRMGLPRTQVFGSGTALDSIRLRRLLGDQLGVDRNQVQAICMGEHGDSSFIPTSHISVGGMPLREYLSLMPGLQRQLDFGALAERVRESGSSIVNGKGCTEFGIGSTVAGIIGSILHNDRRVIPLSAHLEGEYGERGISIGVPCLLGVDGIEQIFEYELTYDETRAMRKSCNTVRGYVNQIFGEDD